jgi:hypothetical protein
MKLLSPEELMFDRFGKLLSAGVATLILLAFSGCGEDKGPVRTIEDKDVKKDEGKPGGAR